MKTKDEISNGGLEKIGLIKIFSNMDTQSAIVAAVAISLGTVLLNYLVELCNFVYWRAYFNRFHIPLEYFDEAIIPETGIKYTIVLYIPVVLFLWWGLNALSDLINKMFKSKFALKLKKKKKRTTLPNSEKRYMKCLKIIAIFFVYFVLFILTLYVVSFFSYKDVQYSYLCIILCAEASIYIFSRLCKNCFSSYCGFSKKVYVKVRIIGGILAVYLVLGYVFFVGSFSNSGVFEGGQVVNLVNNLEDESQPPFFNVKQGDKAEVKMVLLETENYYYVTNAELENRNGNLCLTIRNDDTYRFIDRVDCPITSKYVNLSYFNKKSDENKQDTIMWIYIGSVFTSVFLFGCLLSIPARKDTEEKIS